jgi:YD repeat-containing protein
MAATAPVLNMAKTNLPKGMAPMESLLNDLLKREFINQDIYDRIKADEDLAHYFKPKTRAKKAKATTAKTKKSSGTLQERNDEAFDECRCFARIWEHEGGLGYDNIQCSRKKVEKGDIEKVMDEFKDKMTEEQLEALPEYLEKCDGCYCKNHLKMDFFMPGGWWLKKVNEPRPEKPMLPKGSFKDGYTDEHKEHRWMYDAEGNKNERTSNRGRKCGVKKEKVEEPVEEVVEEPVAQPVEEDDGKGTGLKKNEEVQEDESEKAFDDEDDKEKEHPYIVDGVEYKKVWDEDDEQWVITIETDDGMQMVGFPSEDGGIEWADEEEEEAHAGRVN